MKEFSLADFGSHLEKLSDDVRHSEEHALKRCAKVVEKRAKAKFGQYQAQAGPFAGWAELADSTKQDRERKGYPEDEPLLRTGETRDSIQTSVSLRTLEAQIGSDSDIAVFQELGTSKMPPRSFLGGAMADSLEDIKQILRSTLVGTIQGRKVTAALVGDEVVPGGIAIEG